MRLPRPEKGFFKTLLTLAVPLMLQNLITFSVGFADNLMVGSLGERAISGVYLGSQPQSFLQTVVVGIDSAMLIMAAQYWGKKDTIRIKLIFAIAVKVAVGLALIFTIAAATVPRFILGLFTQDVSVMEQGLSYLRYVCWSYVLFAASQLLITAMKSVEYVKIGMHSSAISLSVNVVVNYLLIFGKLGLPKMGVAGAAVATLISRVIEFCIVSFYVFRKDKRLKLKVYELFSVDKELLQDFGKYGTPVIAGQVVWALNVAVQSSIIGSMGPSATSAVSICSMMFQAISVMLFALSGAVGVLTGKMVGAGEIERVKNHTRIVQLMYLCVGVAFCCFVLLVRPFFISLYNLTSETGNIASQFLAIQAISLIGTCYQGHSLMSLVKAGGDTKFVFINDTIFTWCIVIPGALIALHVFCAPPWVVYICLKSDEILKCFVAYFKINSFDWIKNLTRA